MSGAEIVVLPSRSEGLPRVILEAIALGRKVIAPPNIPEFDRHISEFVLSRTDIATLAETLQRVWNLDLKPSFPFSPYYLNAVTNATVATYTAALH
jgi:glycosyltransferase involved in cell wall biosynthesis